LGNKEERNEIITTKSMQTNMNEKINNHE